jgi:hypothetical protein
VRVEHDRAAFHLSILVEESRDIAFGKTWRNASDEEVRAGIDRAFFIGIFHARVGWWRRTSSVSHVERL